MRQHHALGRAGGARGVDDRGDVVERRRRSVGGEIGWSGRGEVGIVRDGIAGDVGLLEHHDVLERGQRLADLEEPLEETGVLDDGQLGLAVVDEVFDLLGRGRVVDRNRRGSEEQYGEVERVELGTVAQHQHDGVALADTERFESGHESRCEIGDVVQGPRRPRAVGVLPAHDLDAAVALHVGEVSAREVPSGDAVVQVLARDHASSLARVLHGTSRRVARASGSRGRSPRHL